MSAAPVAAPHLQARRAEALADRLPPLLVAAERVAATVAQGVHGRRRVGQGDSFWQFRPFFVGDSASRIDWRQSARSDRAYVRETEWEAAQTVVLWRDGAAGMRWQSRPDIPAKIDRAGLLMLALAALLLRGGERVRLLAGGARTCSGRSGLERLAEELGRLPEGDGLPPDIALPRHARAVLIGDLLGPLEAIQETVGRLAAVPVTGHLLQVLDPAEALLPYSGRVRFEGMRHDLQTLIPRVEGIRDAYAKRLAEQQAGLAAICAAAGFSFSIHRTDHPPETALLALYTALAPQAGLRAAGGR
jgi:uncharacterized protein (DUF58 family)